MHLHSHCQCESEIKQEGTSLSLQKRLTCLIIPPPPSPKRFHKLLKLFTRRALRNVHNVHLELAHGHLVVVVMVDLLKQLFYLRLRISWGGGGGW